jgi:hypothetical protein
VVQNTHCRSGEPTWDRRPNGSAATSALRPSPSPAHGNRTACRGTPAAPHHYFTMSERAKGCRRKAAECELAARLSRDVEMRTMYRDLAQLWREVASELEHLEATKQAAITSSPS